MVQVVFVVLDFVLCEGVCEGVLAIKRVRLVGHLICSFVKTYDLKGF